MNSTTGQNIDIQELLREVRDEIRGLRDDVRKVFINHADLTGQVQAEKQRTDRLQTDFDNHVSATASVMERLKAIETVQTETNRNIDNNKRTMQLMISGILLILAFITFYLKH